MYDLELLDITTHVSQLSNEAVKQQRRRRASWNKTKSRQNRNKQRNSMIRVNKYLLNSLAHDIVWRYEK